MNDYNKFHNFDLSNQFYKQIVDDPTLVGLPKDFLKNKSENHRADLIIGEYLYRVYQNLGIQISRILKRGQWSYEIPDWFDHRHHTLNWQEESKNSWSESASLVLRNLPEGGKILNLCAGDAYFDSNFFKNMSSEILCVDINDKDEYKNFLIHQNIKDSNKIQYLYGDILQTEFRQNYYNVVIMRSAIEHFSEKNQILLFDKINKCLVDGGVYIGDTPANPEKYAQKEHSAHENEWMNEKEAYDLLIRYFDDVEVYSVYCNIDKRSTIFWKAKKKNNG